MASPDDIPLDPATLVRFARVVSVDHAGGTCVVATGDPDAGEIESASIPFTAARCGAISIWLPPSVGEQVLLFSPDGDIAGATIMGALPQDDAPAAGDSPAAVLRFDDGATFRYDPESHQLEISLPGGASITVPDGVDVAGDIRITGKLTATDDVIGGGKSLKSHVHTGVQAGGGLTGAPQ